MFTGILMLLLGGGFVSVMTLLVVEEFKSVRVDNPRVLQSRENRRVIKEHRKSLKVLEAKKAIAPELSEADKILKKSFEKRDKALVRLSEYELDVSKAIKCPEINDISHPLTADYVLALKKLSAVEKMLPVDATVSSANEFKYAVQTLCEKIAKAELPMVTRLIDDENTSPEELDSLQERLSLINRILDADTLYSSPDFELPAISDEVFQERLSIVSKDMDEYVEIYSFPKNGKTLTGFINAISENRKASKDSHSLKNEKKKDFENFDLSFFPDDEDDVLDLCMEEDEDLRLLDDDDSDMFGPDYSKAESSIVQDIRAKETSRILKENLMNQEIQEMRQQLEEIAGLKAETNLSIDAKTNLNLIQKIANDQLYLHADF